MNAVLKMDEAVHPELLLALANYMSEPDHRRSVDIGVVLYCGDDRNKPGSFWRSFGHFRNMEALRPWFW